MPKKNGQKGPEGPNQKHLHSRVSYLFQATTFLANVKASSRLESHGRNPARDSMDEGVSEDKQIDDSLQEKASNIDGLKNPTLSCRLLAQAGAISQKSQIRLAPAMKNSICKRCNVILTPGSSASTRLENHSRNGKKSWADVLVVTCAVCQTAKRYPIGAKHQVKKKDRSSITKTDSNKRARKIRIPMSMDT